MVWSGYFGVQFAEGIRAGIANLKIPFSYDVIEIDQGSAPNGGDVQKLLRDDPDAIFLMMSEPAAAFVVKQLRSFRYRGKIVLQSSMLQSYDRAVRAPFVGSLQQKFPTDESQFRALQSEVKKKLGEEVADDFIFSYDGFKAVLKEANLCRAQQRADLESCLMTSLRNEAPRQGASGQFRFMKDGSTERPMVFRTITEEGFQ